MLSWMAKCPLAKNIILSSGGAISYVTPLTVEKLRDSHNELMKYVNENIRVFLQRHFSRIELKSREVCLTLTIDGEDKYVVCGRPDITYFVYEGVIGPYILVVEVTLSPSIDHMVRGELIFYIMGYYMLYGIPTVGLIIGVNSIRLIVPKPTALLNNSVPMLLRRLFSKSSYEDALKKAEDKRGKSPWICSLCDLKHLCPLGGEV